jgi:hypothetical protein
LEDQSFARAAADIGLAITLVILHITWASWRTVRRPDHHDHDAPDVSDRVI